MKGELTLLSIAKSRGFLIATVAFLAAAGGCRGQENASQQPGDPQAATQQGAGDSPAQHVEDFADRSGSFVADKPVPISAPPGFRVTRYAGDNLAHNISSMTIDSRGRVVVSGPGYIKILHDDHLPGELGHGIADRATNFCEYPGSGAHGMLFLGNDLLCNGDRGLRLLRDANGDDRWDGRATREEWLKVNHPEHGAHGIVHGPDGWIYMICGNDAGIGPQHATGGKSPVRHSVAGALLRISPDGSQSQIVADGFRNPYDVAFTDEGSLLTVDSDGERDQYLPWYTPTRMFDIAQGQQHGWLLRGWQRSWSRPEVFFDNVERLTELGRGSPTGLVVYRHRQFPQHYRGGAFSACWTLGRVYYVPLESEAASYKRTEPETFLQTTGGTGFAPVDLAVGPEGDLFVAIGGRGTQGGVFRVTYVGGAAGQEQNSENNTKLPPSVTNAEVSQVLNAPQPLASWSRAKWQPIARDLGNVPFVEVARDESAALRHRRRAIEILVQLFGGIEEGLAKELARSGFAEIRAHTAWAIGQGGWKEPSRRSDALALLLARLTGDVSPLVQRRAWESLQSFGDLPDSDAFAEAWFPASISTERRVRDAMLNFAAQPAQRDFAIRSIAKSAGDDPWMAAMELRLRARCQAIEPEDLFRRATMLFSQSMDAELRLTALRLAQIALGDIELAANPIPSADGYMATAPQDVPSELRATASKSLTAAFPSGDDDVDREVARALALTGLPEVAFLDQLAQKWTAESTVADDIHYLMVATRLLEAEKANAEIQIKAHTLTAVASALVRLYGKLESRGQFPSRNWPARVGELAGILIAKAPQLGPAIIEHEAFGRVDHSLFVAKMDGAVRVRGVRRLLRTTLGDDPHFGVGYSGWAPELVNLLRHLPEDEAAPQLEAAWEEPALRDAALPLLARRPQANDRWKYVESLTSMQPSIVGHAVDALLKLEDQREDSGAGQGGRTKPVEELSAIVLALRSACLVPAQRGLRDRLRRLFERSTGKDFGLASEPNASQSAGADIDGETARLLAWYQPCFDWFEKQYPDSGVGMSTPFAGAGWEQRLGAINWESGDSARGEVFYRQKTCARCHDGAGGVGPDLRGITARYSREDLFVSIVDPQRDVAPLYRTTLIETTDGLVYAGLIIYESPESTLLQLPSGETIRISDAEIRTSQRSRQSLMPQGLLDDASDQDLADLDAYLRAISKLN
ncbi:MAG: c-type cytochrome [Pirellulales bacterium]|nr:c-type cytochrome [Pirellulales bacterium]